MSGQLQKSLICLDEEALNAMRYTCYSCFTFAISLFFSSISDTFALWHRRNYKYARSSSEKVIGGWLNALTMTWRPRPRHSKTWLTKSSAFSLGTWSFVSKKALPLSSIFLRPLKSIGSCLAKGLNYPHPRILIFRFLQMKHLFPRQNSTWSADPTYPVVS